MLFSYFCSSCEACLGIYLLEKHVLGVFSPRNTFTFQRSPESESTDTGIINRGPALLVQSLNAYFLFITKRRISCE